MTMQLARPRPAPTVAQCMSLADYWHAQATRPRVNAATAKICYDEEVHWLDVAASLKLIELGATLATSLDPMRPASPIDATPRDPRPTPRGPHPLIHPRRRSNAPR